MVRVLPGLDRDDRRQDVARDLRELPGSGVERVPGVEGAPVMLKTRRGAFEIETCHLALLFARKPRPAPIRVVLELLRGGKA